MNQVVVDVNFIIFGTKERITKHKHYLFVHEKVIVLRFTAESFRASLVCETSFIVGVSKVPIVKGLNERSLQQKQQVTVLIIILLEQIHDYVEPDITILVNDLVDHVQLSLRGIFNYLRVAEAMLLVRVIKDQTVQQIV
ncbi:hypothetical protein DGG96_07305 [Legionella qingyii]|uniref:Uncharacterized protein n=1 Tax=Legionella qingyii TaxID=2184757 RepID=A0A317U2L5_9GAMM|nr:hypothetical protein DGG96_07305 [Legionella qingyii]